MMLFWAWVLLAFDVWALIAGVIELSLADGQKVYEKFHFINQVSIPYFITRIIWGFRIYKYGHLFRENSSENPLLPDSIVAISTIEIILSFFAISIILIASLMMIVEYFKSLNYGKRCPLSLFLKTYKILDYSADDYNLKYCNKDINFSFIPHFIACELLYKEKSKKRKNDKKREIKKSQKELYSIMIKDLQRIQKEEEAKAARYFSTAEKTTKDIQKTLDVHDSL